MEKNAQMNIKKERKTLKRMFFSLHVTVNMDNVWYDRTGLIYFPVLDHFVMEVCFHHWQKYFCRSRARIIIPKLSQLWTMFGEIWHSKSAFWDKNLKLKLQKCCLFINRKKFSYFLDQKSVTGFKKSNDREIFESMASVLLNPWSKGSVIICNDFMNNKIRCDHQRNP